MNDIEPLVLNNNISGDNNDIFPDTMGEIHAFDDKLETRYDLITQIYPPKIMHQNSISLEVIPSGSVHLIIFSPMYNVAKKYKDEPSGDKQANYIYLQLMGQIFKECFRVLVDGGKICVNISNFGNKPYTELDSILSMKLIEAGFDPFQNLIWLKGQAGAKSAWGSWLNSSNPYFRSVKENVIIARKGNKSLKKPLPTSQVTMTRDGFLRSTLDVWYIKPVRNSVHPAPFPVGLPHRLINMFTTTDMVVLDVMAGSGQTIEAAKNLGRKAIGVDISKTYAHYMRERFHVQDYIDLVNVYGTKWANWFNSLDA